MSELERIKAAMASGEHTDGDLAYAVEQWESALLRLDTADQRARLLESEIKTVRKLADEYGYRLETALAELAGARCLSSPDGRCQVRRAQEFAGDPRQSVSLPVVETLVPVEPALPPEAQKWIDQQLQACDDMQRLTGADFATRVTKPSE